MLISTRTDDYCVFVAIVRGFGLLSRVFVSSALSACVVVSKVKQGSMFHQDGEVLPIVAIKKKK